MHIMTCFETVVDLLHTLKPALSEKYGVSTIGLFGSIVRDDFSSDKSDLDVIVDFSKPIGIEFVDVAEFLEARIKRKIDLVSKNGINDKYLSEIEQGIVYV